jgi:hypothetical protein
MTIYGQNGITFPVEELSKPEKLLPATSPADIWERLILKEMHIPPYRVKNFSIPVGKATKGSIEAPFNIIAQSKAPSHLANLGYHPFFNGMYQAYADHRPFVLSPDMIWLLITQGFAQHVNAHPEKMRDYFVDYSGKLMLTVLNDKVTLDNPQSPWEEIFPEFTRKIAEHAGKDLMELLTADFSTTTPVEKLASEITIIEAMKPYFEFIVFHVVCGIPEITLTGTPDDWRKIVDKTGRLSKYDLSWWTKELEPLLEEFVKASEGKVDKSFWRNMFKYHSQEKYGAPEIDGWIVKFFPYDKKGKRNNLQFLEGGDKLPEEIVKVDLKYISENETTPLELWAGFMGLEQNSENFALKPVIGWMIRKKDVNNELLRKKFDEDNRNGSIAIRVKEVPSELFYLQEIISLEIAFIDRIIIPEELAKVKIEQLKLSGTIDGAEKNRIKAMFPDTELIINRECIVNPRKSAGQRIIITE